MYTWYSNCLQISTTDIYLKHTLQLVGQSIPGVLCQTFSHNKSKQGSRSQAWWGFAKLMKKTPTVQKELPEIRVRNYPCIVGEELTCDRTHPRYRGDLGNNTATRMVWLHHVFTSYAQARTDTTSVKTSPYCTISLSMMLTEFPDLKCPFMYSHEVSVKQFDLQPNGEKTQKPHWYTKHSVVFSD